MADQGLATGSYKIMKSINDLVEIYDSHHNNRINMVFHAVGILLATTGLLAFLWGLPADLVKSRLGNHPFANWATVYAVLMIIYFGSQSFSLTFAGGVFYQGLLFGVDYLEQLEWMDFSVLTGILLISGFGLMALGHLIEGNPKSLKSDLSFLLIAPTWLFRFVYEKLGVSF